MLSSLPSHQSSLTWKFTGESTVMSFNSLAILRIPHALMVLLLGQLLLLVCPNLLQPIEGTNGETTFPFLSVMRTKLYENGNIVSQ